MNWGMLKEGRRPGTKLQQPEQKAEIVCMTSKQQTQRNEETEKQMETPY